MIENEKLVEWRIIRSKKGLPCLWETGGGYSNTGDAIIIASSDGKPKKPLYIRQRGHLACGEHALFVIMPCDIVVKANHHRYDFNIVVYRIVEIREDRAILERLCLYDRGEWDTTPPEGVLQAVEAAEKKATCYHCREPHYAASPQEE